MLGVFFFGKARMSLQWIFLVLMLLPVSAAATDASYLDELKAQARFKGLANRAEWHDLVHYKPYIFGVGLRSLADDVAFFLAPQGKTDPEAELEATLAAFFSDQEETETQQNPQCAFVARYHWLKSELDFDATRLPPRACRRFEEWRAALNARELTLVFPAAYLNSPASMYGHTLLRIDGAGQDERTRLLAHSISYAAATNETSGLLFAIKGLVGGYSGVFSVVPYYAKVKEYNDLENRDIWEYRLDFTQSEVDRVLMHAWELRPIRFDYYFFDENCSYHLLSLLDVGRPGLHVVDHFPMWAIPLDTVRAVDSKGLVKDIVYRPSRGAWLRHRQDTMPASQIVLARALANGEREFSDQDLSSLPKEERARVLELAFEYLEYQRLSGAREKIESIGATSARLRSLLLARSELAVSSPPPIPVPDVRPDQGHASARLAFGVGVADKQRFQEFNIRPAYHDILDPFEGYVAGAQIEFFNLRLRHTEGERGVHMEQFNLIDIVSLSPRDQLLRPLSWRVDAAWVRKRFPDGDRPLIFRLSGGAGPTYAIGKKSLMYGMLETAFDVDSNFEDGYAVATGPMLGVLVSGSRASTGITARALRYGIGDDHNTRELRLVQTYNPSRQMQWRFELGRSREFDHAWNSAALFWNLYF